ncbi:baseplate assembly protein [Sphingomonas pokkalii]|uniref:Baseplate assembly protein n=1 Tax=Sphingomonas pokkalii TaxID=2175090 RepID=A0A2U0SJX7_9SPHN|nr:baseplate J/gp47 family protein [Sphingomonas pokkalii]PVX31629.1 baseplate assembly protein [Sphingomonas pokkalii]
MADTSATFTAVDLSRLPAPTVIEPLSFEDIYAEMLSSLQALVPGFDATVESDPAVMLLQVCAYRELMLRGRVNDAAKAVMPAFATGTDLDHLAALMSVARLQLSPGAPANDIPPTYEEDTALRARLVLAPEGFSVAGPEGAYIFHARSADGDVLDASATSPAPGRVLVTVLSRAGDGTASPALLAKVAAHVSDETVRPLTDAVTVQSATIVPYQIVATLTTFSGPDDGIVLAEAQRRVEAYRDRQHRLGMDITRSGIIAALHAEGVQNVALSFPAADIAIDRTQAGWCTGITITYAGTGE